MSHGIWVGRMSSPTTFLLKVWLRPEAAASLGSLWEMQNFQVTPQTHWIRICIWIRSPVTHVHISTSNFYNIKRDWSIPIKSRVSNWWAMDQVFLKTCLICPAWWFKKIRLAHVSSSSRPHHSLPHIVRRTQNIIIYATCQAHVGIWVCSTPTPTPGTDPITS